MNRVQRSWANGISLLLGRAANLAANLLIVVWVSRYLGVVAFGSYSAALGLLATFRLLAALGFENLIPRQIGRDPALTGRYLTHSLVLAITSALVLTAIMDVLALIFHYTVETVHEVWVASLALLPLALVSVYESFFIGRERAGYVALMNLFEVTGRLAFSLVVLARGYGAIAVIGVYVLLQWVTCVIEAMVFWMRVDRPEQCLDWGFAQRLARELVTFSAITILAGLFWNIGLMMLSALANEYEIGIYNAAYKIVFVWSIVPTSLMAVVFPFLSRSYQDDRAEFVRVILNALRYLGAVALPLAVGGAVLADDLIMFLYGSEFRASVMVLQTLIWALVPLFLNNVLYRILLASDRQQSTLRVTAVSLGLNLLFCAGLVPLWGGWGAAVSGLLAISAAFVQNLWLAWHDLVVGEAVICLGKFALASALMALVVIFLRQTIGWVGGAVIGAAFYGVMVILLRAFTDHDLQILRRLFGRPMPVSPETTKHREVVR